MTLQDEPHPPRWTDFLAAHPTFFAPPQAVLHLGGIGSGGRWALQQAAAAVAAAGTPVVVLDDAANGWTWWHLAQSRDQLAIQALPPGEAPPAAGLTLYEGPGDPALLARLLTHGAPPGGGVLVLTAPAAERAAAPYGAVRAAAAAAGWTLWWSAWEAAGGDLAPSSDIDLPPPTLLLTRPVRQAALLAAGGWLPDGAAPDLAPGHLLLAPTPGQPGQRYCLDPAPYRAGPGSAPPLAADSSTLDPNLG